MLRRITFAVVAIALGFTLVGGATAEVKWESGDWEAILASAKKEGKHVFVDFYATWCGPCKRLEKETYTDAKVDEFMSGLVNVKFDAEKDFGETLADQYRVNAYPTLVVIGPDGREVDRHLGFLTADEFLDVIGGYIDGRGTIADYERKLAADPDNLDLLLIVGMKHADAARAAEASKALDRALELDKDDSLGKRAEILYTLGGAFYDADNYAKAKGYYVKLIAENPDSEWYESGTRRLAYVEYKLGNADVAVANYYEIVKRHPDDPGTLNGFAWFCAQRGIGLQAALIAAQKGAEISNRDPGILDTLAEVHFARGEFDDAIRVGKEALAKEPDDTYFKEQVEKFEKAKAEKDSQAKR